MKIAVFYNISFSGAKRVVQEHVKGLKECGHYVDVYTTDIAKDMFDPAIHADNKFTYDFSPRSVPIPLFNRAKKDFVDVFINLRKIHKRMAHDIDAKDYDLVLVHTDINTQAPFILRFLKTPNVYYCLEPLRNAYEYSLRFKGNYSYINKFYEKVNRFIRKEIDRVNTLYSDRIIALSLFGRERIIAAYDLYPKVSYLGVDEKVFKVKNLKKRNQVLFVAEKYPIYGYDLALQAMELIPKQIRPELKIVSWKKNNAERISDEELVDIYNESLVTLSLSRFDTFGLVPLESMACGTPVIALNVAGYRETMINNETGYLVDFTPTEIAEKIIYCIKNKDKARKLGLNGREWVEKNWTWKKQILNLNELLIDIVNNR